MSVKIQYIMKKYFIHDGQRQLGPFSAMELIEKGITKCTPVYTSGLGRYVRAAEIPMLNDAFNASSDDLKKMDAENRVQTNKPKLSFIKKILYAVVPLLVVGILIVLWQMQGDVSDAPTAVNKVTINAKKDVQLSQTELEQKEAASPLEYLSVHGKMHKNLIGKKIIKGSITNMASLASYKDLQMAVIFLSGTQTELQTQQFFVNGVVSPNNKISFRSVFIAPPETAGFKLKILSVNPAQNP